MINHSIIVKKPRYIKLNPHNILPEHDVSIWVDNNLIPEFINSSDILTKNNFTNSNIMLYQHRFRNCIYDEGNRVIELKKEKKEIVDSQLKKYSSQGFPKKYGLYETGFMFRKNNNETNKFNELWWDEINNHSGRDQLSQMYVSWKLNFKLDSIKIGSSAYSNPYLKTSNHLIDLKF